MIVYKKSSTRDLEEALQELAEKILELVKNRERNASRRQVE